MISLSSLEFPRCHIKRLRGLFQKLVTTGLKFKPSKYELFKTTTSFSGHIVTNEGIETDPRKIAAISNWPTPVTVTDARSFLGFTNHYRCITHCYVHIAGPLNA